MFTQARPKTWMDAATHGALSGGAMAAAITPIANHFTKQPLAKGLLGGTLLGAGIGGGMGLLTHKLEQNANKKGKKLSPLMKALPTVGGLADDAFVIGSGILRARMGKIARGDYGLAKLAFGK